MTNAAIRRYGPTTAQIQNLFGVSLQIERGMHLIEQSPGEASTVLDAAIRGLHTVIDDLRHRIEHLIEPRG